MAGDRLGARLECHRPLEVLRPVLLVRDLAPVTIKIPFGRPPTGCVDSGHDAVHAVRGEEPVLDAVPETVRVDRIAEVPVCVACCPLAAA